MKTTEDNRVLSNHLYKKEQAEIHNQSLFISDNMLQMGECKCGGTLFMYLQSNPENYFKYYCTDCNSQGDIRNPKDKDVIYNGPSKVIDYITLNAYGEDAIKDHMNDPPCANRAKRVKSVEQQLIEESR